MKTLLKMALVALFAFTLVSPAMAYFENGKLVAVAYDRTPFGDDKIEVAVDLGILVGTRASTAYDWSQHTTPIAQSTDVIGHMDLSLLGNLSSKALSFFGSQGGTAYNVYATNEMNVNRNPLALTNGRLNVLGLYAGLADANGVAVTDIDNINSFRSVFDGAYGGTLTATTAGQAELANIMTDGYVQMYLNTSAETVAALRLYSNGDIVIGSASAAPAVPVPAAVWMLASGLVGLVGVRRKK